MHKKSCKGGLAGFLSHIPAGLLLLPLVGGMLIHSFLPDALMLGSFTTALFSCEGTATLIALQLFCLGTQLRWNSLSGIVRRGGVLFLAKLLAGLLVALVYRFWVGDASFLGISALAAVAAISNVNGSIYLSVMTNARETDYMACTPIVTLTNGPFLTLFILGMSGLSEIPIAGFAATVLPMVFGILLGNFFVKAEEFFKPGILLLLPFIGFTLGAGIDVRQALQGGVGGVLLAGFVLLLGVPIAAGMDRLLNRGSGTGGIAVSATGANAAGVPAAVALANPVWQSRVGEASAQLAVCIVVSAIVISIAAAAWDRRKKNTLHRNNFG